MVAMMKYMVIILCSAYTTRKIINARERPNLIRVLLAPLFFLGSSLIVCLLRLYIPSVSLLAMVGLSICAHMYFFSYNNKHINRCNNYQLWNYISRIFGRRSLFDYPFARFSIT